MNINDEAANIKNKANETFNDAAESATDVLKNTSHEIVKSGKDWVSYIKTHPLQSVLFAMIGYFAVKGMCQD